MNNTTGPETRESRLTANSYFRHFEGITPPMRPPISAARQSAWHAAAGLALGLGIWYLHWRWTASLNPEALVLSYVVVTAETLAFIGTAFFIYDIWEEVDTPQQSPPKTRRDAHLTGPGTIGVDIIVTTYDEPVEIVAATLMDAAAVIAPPGCKIAIYLADDGNRPEMAALAANHGAVHLPRAHNTGFKAGNLKNALMKTSGDFFVICDADTRLGTGFVQNTLGYFREEKTAWVQTPHWFYDLPEGEGHKRHGRDPLASDPTVFFDIVQRRRNRSGASFCCGAGSIHRREAVFSNALDSATRKASPSSLQPLQPFQYHVSEDILTSMHLHASRNGWRSVYHPQVEARMLSPWSLGAWVTQRTKYAGGTVDILLRSFPRLIRRLPPGIAMHYIATFWAYISTLWLTVLIFAPCVSLITGHSPVAAWSLTFFSHFLPALIATELAIGLGCKDHDHFKGRLQAISSAPLVLVAATQVVMGRKPRFPATPKVPTGQAPAGFARLCAAIVIFFGLTIAFGFISPFFRPGGWDAPHLVFNTFWATFNALAFAQVLRAEPQLRRQFAKITGTTPT
ncbi:glycosyltransferase [Alphaproteobacteria bacterium KMM 3653]|uniref:Glycosyltransferase n=1 Tax=Harenicola maris TaxID=2841044 RepID=A0AAP2CP24_9RHOB|nr:glycosyltransferase [Harenicola maris]